MLYVLTHLHEGLRLYIIPLNEINCETMVISLYPIL